MFHHKISGIQVKFNELKSSIILEVVVHIVGEFNFLWPIIPEKVNPDPY